MGIKYTIYLLISFVFVSCGNFVGFQSASEVDTGALESFELYMTQEEYLSFINSLGSEEFAYVSFDDSRSNDPFSVDQGRIRVRGNSSRYKEKKSFTLSLEIDGEEQRYALDAGGDVWFGYGLTLYLTNLLGVHSNLFSPVALYINEEYEGYYNIVRLYNEDLNSSSQYDSPAGELYKPDFEYTYDNGDTHSWSEKKFPDDDNFALYDNLIVNYENMSTEDWVEWIETPGVCDMEGMANYMIVRDFLGVLDTVRVNHYIYFHDDGFTVLPWDADGGYSYGSIGGDSPLTLRMTESDVFKALYIQKMEDAFLDTDAAILQSAQDYIDDNYALLDQAAAVEPYFTYARFESEYNFFDTFFDNRPQNIIDNNPDWGFVKDR